MMSDTPVCLGSQIVLYTYNQRYTQGLTHMCDIQLLFSENKLESDEKGLNC